MFYKPGRSNLVSDALSRKFSEEEPLLLEISSPIPYLVHQLQQYYTLSKNGKNLVHEKVKNKDEHN